MNDSDLIPDEQRLMAQLLRNYDPSARPVYNASDTVSVAFGIALAQLSDMVGDHQNRMINRPIIQNLTDLFDYYANRIEKILIYSNEMTSTEIFFFFQEKNFA